jgi:hypothetical protein
LIGFKNLIENGEIHSSSVTGVEPHN